MAKGSFLIVYSAIFFRLLVHFAAAQTTHVVGDVLGWDIPPNTSVSYPNWVSGKTFMVGDTLVFNFMTNQHDVVRVPQASYDACTGDNAIGSIITTGPANITLDSAGDHYYICTFGRHCQNGQKLAIAVDSSTPGAANPPMTAPPATPSPASPQPDACAPTPSSSTPAAAPTTRAAPLPPVSASTSLAGSFLMVIMSFGIALVF